MTLGLAKSYTPSAGQIGDATSYNTDIGALFNAFNGLEAQTATLGGLTIRPTSNSTTTFNATNSSGTSIFSVDTTNGIAKYKTASIVSQNITNTRLTSDFTTTSTSFVARTGGSASLTTLKASAKVLVILHSNWSASTGVNIDVRINVDSGTYTNLGRFNVPSGAVVPIGGSVLITGLTAAAHTFSIEVLTSAGTISNIPTSGTEVLYTFELNAWEI